MNIYIYNKNIMVFGILGTKIGMTQIFDIRDNAIPVTIIKTDPCYITQIKYKDICGYNAIQLGYKERILSNKNLKKPNLGHLKKNNINPLTYLKEFKNINLASYKIGDIVSLDGFNIGEFVSISGLTIGKGNTSNIKRNNFGRGPMSHGSKHHRLQGSLGAGTSPGRVFPGKKMPGRLGNTRCTLKNIEIINIDKDENLLLLKGSVPGKKGNLIKITLNK